MHLRRRPVRHAVAVGTALSGRPPHRSQRAALPHWAPASDVDAEPLRGIWMVFPSPLSLDVSTPALCSRAPGTASDACFAVADSPWPGSFPPPPPQIRRLGKPLPSPLCSEVSQVLRPCPTPHVRSSLDCLLRVPNAARRAISLRQTWGLPVPAYEVSAHARGLRPRGARHVLANSHVKVLPSVCVHDVGTPEDCVFEAQYSACAFPCQRLGHVLTGVPP